MLIFLLFIGTVSAINCTNYNRVMCGVNSIACKWDDTVSECENRHRELALIIIGGGLVLCLLVFCVSIIRYTCKKHKKHNYESLNF